jgi:hypothetical protein
LASTTLIIWCRFSLRILMILGCGLKLSMPNIKGSESHTVGRNGTSCLVTAWSLHLLLPLWDRAKSFKAVSDFPPVLFVDELIAAYPDAKILLTVRDDVEAWYKSVLNTLWTGNFIFGPPKTFLQTLVQRIVPRPAAWPVMQRVYGYTPLGNFPAEGCDWYRAHNEHVRKAAEGRQFLEYNVKEGWGPLCKFLEVEEPKVPFPGVNDTKAWQDFTEKTKMQSVLELLGKAGKVCVPVVLGSVTLWYLRKVQ